MEIFDSIRHDNVAGKFAEPKFSFLNRSSRREAVRCRQNVEKWFCHYPSNEQMELRSRIRDTNDSNHQSALFELFLHELLLKLNCKVKIHTELQGTLKVPDFLVTCPDGSQFFLEAVLATGESAQQSKERARINDVYDILNRKLKNPDYFIGLRLRGAPATPPSARDIGRFLNVRLAVLDFDNVTDMWQNSRKRYPNWIYEHDGWSIEFYPIPKSPKLRGNTDVRPLHAWSSSPQMVNPEIAIRDVVIKKASRYGELSLPYVVAVNPLNDFTDDIASESALFGDEIVKTYISYDGNKKNKTEFTRRPNGVWCGTCGPTHTRVSAVLIAERFSVWRLNDVETCLFINPWAQKLYCGTLAQLTRRQVEDNYIIKKDGKSVKSIMRRRCHGGS